MKFPSHTPGNLIPGSGVFTGLYAETDCSPEHPDGEDVHDPEKVQVVMERKARGRRRFGVVCAHAGKAFCWSDFRQSLLKLPLARSHILLYDNSNDTAHGRRLMRLANGLDAVTVIRDENQTQSVESTTQISSITARCSSVYQEIYERRLPPGDILVNLEDDIGIPDGGFERLLNILDQYPEVGTVAPDCRDRRVMVSRGETQSIVCNFLETRQIGGAKRLRLSVEPVEPKQHGVEWVGATHMGLWLTRRECIEEIGMTTTAGGPLGHDIQWGLRLNRAGWGHAVDWSIRLKHYYQDRSTREKLYV